MLATHQLIGSSENGPRAPRRALGLSLLLALGALGAGCTEDVGTSVRLALVYKDAWNIASADVIADESEKSSPISREMLILLPDEAAGEVMPFEVWGVRDGERIAHGSAVALPRKGETVGATLVLERLPCGVFCTVGELRCEDDGGIGACVRDADDCLAWGEPEACPAATPFCTAGECRFDCDNECEAGEGTCVDAATERRCGQFDADICRDFGSTIPCAAGQLCYGGRCAAPCTYAAALANNAVADTAGAYAPSLAIDAAGTQHLVYSAETTRQLTYLRRPRGGAWSAPATIGAVGESPTLAVDKAGVVHLAYFSPTGTVGLRYGVRTTAGAWTFSTVELGATVGVHHAIAVDSAGVVHLVYHDAAGALLRHASGAAPPFALETADTELGFGVDLAVEGQTLHVISYSDTNKVWYSTKSPTAAWLSAMVVDLDDAEHADYARTSIAIDRAGTLHVAYTDAYNDLGTPDDQLRYTSKPAGGSWTNRVIIDNTGTQTGALPDVSVDLFDGVHVAYRTIGATTGLRYAHRIKGAASPWVQTVPPATPGLELSLGVDPAGLLHIVSSSRPGGLVETTRPCQ